MVKALSVNTRIAYKLFFALLGFSAIVTEMVVTIDRGTFNPANFFSYLTIQVNILVFIALLVGAILLAKGKSIAAFESFRGAVAVYIFVVGIGFALLLSGLENVALTAVPWDNIVLHYIIPFAMLGDLLLNRPRRKLSFKQGLLWLLYPLAYGVYSLVRGAIIGWYPYPFLNPANNENGYGGIAIVMTALTLLGTALVWAVTKYSRQGSKK